MDNTKKRLSPELRTRRRQIRDEAKGLLRQSFWNKGINEPIRITNTGVKEWLNQPHKYYERKNELLLNIGGVIENAEYKGVSYYKGKKTHIFETKICEEASWIIATEVKGRGVAIYSISDNEKVLVGIKNPSEIGSRNYSPRQLSNGCL